MRSVAESADSAEDDAWAERPLSVTIVIEDFAQITDQRGFKNPGIESKVL